MTDQYLGPYRLESKLGSGGMGSVFRAVHAKTGQQVAVKLIAEQVADSERFRRRFSVEVETLKKLNHPNIVRLIGYGEEHGRLFYSMDVVDGPSLQQYLKKHKRLGWQETLQFGSDICSALKHAHDLGVIHRDLKPANLLLAPDGRIQLVDFGIAKMFGAGDYTAAGSVLGTADYMAPEQAGEGKITTRTDLYALGSVLYACLAGRAPFGGKSITTVIEALKREAPVPLDLIVPETPEELSELVHQLLEKRPEDRPPTALVVGNRLRSTKRGLEAREAQTHADLGSQTQVDDPTNNDDLDVDPEYLIKNDTEVSKVKPPEHPADGTDGTFKQGARGASEQGTHDVKTLDATLHSDVAQIPRRAPTMASVGADAGTGDEGTGGVKGDTSFRTVDESDRQRGTLSDFRSADQAKGQWLSVAAMVVALLGLIGTAAYLMRNPTADQLFATIDAVDATGDLASARSDIQRFLRLYPEDERADQIRLMADTLDFESTVRRLQRKARQPGGIDELDPPEQAFLAAATEREQDPRKALLMFRQFLAVYDLENYPSSAQTQRLVKLANLQIDTLNARPDLDGNENRKKLEDRVKWASENLSGARQQDFYDGVIGLHKSEDWASEPVERVEKALAAIP